MGKEQAQHIESGVWNNPNVPSGTPGRGEGNMSAWALMNLFHCLNLALFTPVNSAGVPQQQVNNQWILYRQKKFKMLISDYTSLIGSNMFTMPGGAKAKIEKGKFNVYNELFEDVNYRVSSIYDNNFKTTVIIDGA